MKPRRQALRHETKLAARIRPRRNRLGLARLKTADVVQHHSIVLVAGRIDESRVATCVARSFRAKKKNDGPIGVHVRGADELRLDLVTARQQTEQCKNGKQNTSSVHSRF
jgi:phage terminase Nu1 subunit (DNA packaging protein)